MEEAANKVIPAAIQLIDDTSRRLAPMRMNGRRRTIPRRRGLTAGRGTHWCR